MRYISFFSLEYVYTLKQLVSNNCNTFNMCNSMAMIKYMKQLHGFNVISRPALQTTSNWGFPLPHFPKPTTVDFSVSIGKKKEFAPRTQRNIYSSIHTSVSFQQQSCFNIVAHKSFRIQIKVIKTLQRRHGTNMVLRKTKSIESYKSIDLLRSLM